MPRIKKTDTEKMFELFAEMPEFVPIYINNFHDADKTNTKLEYTRDIKIFLEYIVNYIPSFCDTQIIDLTLDDLNTIIPNDVNQYLSVMANGRSKNTVNRKRAVISSMYSYFVSSGMVSNNPVLASKKIDRPDKQLIYLTDEEQARLLNVCRTGIGLSNISERTAKDHYLYEYRDSAMMLLLLDTGLRVSEMLSTDICDYNLDECSVIVKRKGGDIQELYYGDDCAEYLTPYFSQQTEKFEYLYDKKIPAFTGTTGVRLSVRAVEKLVKKYISAAIPEKAKIISPHKLRSSFAMSFYDVSGNDLLLLQKRMGHKNIQTTNIYAKASDKAIKNSRNLLQNKRKGLD